MSRFLPHALRGLAGLAATSLLAFAASDLAQAEVVQLHQGPVRNQERFMEVAGILLRMKSL